jgi:hypothetical protein
MLWLSTTLIGSSIEARDGAIGSIADLLFDETDWTVRWVVVDTGTWLPGRKVLLPPGCLGPPATNSGAVHTELTRQQVQDSPDIDSDAPVSRQSESSLFTHYGWAPYWYPAPGVPAMNMVPMGGIPPFAPLGPRWGALPAQGQPDDVQVPEGDPTLRA